MPDWDAFISYASEDRVAVGEPLARSLQRLGLKIWYDRTELRVGDSLRERIDEGLANCRFGIVILSPAFFGKHYPTRELNGLAQREVDGGRVILPVWHGVSAKEVREYSPPLADRVAADWADGPDAVVAALFGTIGREQMEQIRKDLEKSRELPRITGGSQLLAALHGAYANSVVHDEFETTEDVNLVGELLGIVEDGVDALEEMTAGQKAQLAMEVTQLLRQLTELGWAVFAGAVTEPIGDGFDGDWPVACIAMTKQECESVVRLGGQFMLVKKKPPREGG